MAEAVAPFDPWTAADPCAGRLDPARSVCLPTADGLAIAQALAALANSQGGDVLIGATLTDAGTARPERALPAGAATTALDEALALVDPPVTHLVQPRAVSFGGGDGMVVHVRLSPSTPHLVTATGEIPRLGADGLRRLRSRRELDDLYARGRGERERADRLIDAMIEKLTISHYAFYTIALIACTQQPSGEPYSAAAAGPLAPAGDPFAAAFKLDEAEPHTLPGEIELRSAGDTGAYLRVTRGGCVAAGEIQRRPYHEELDSLDRLRERIEALAMTACRLLRPAGDAVMVPHLFFEGVRGLRLVQDAGRKAISRHAPQDTARFALSLGDALDPGYPARLTDEAVSRLGSVFPPPE